MTSFTNVDQLAAQLPDGGPADAALKDWQHGLQLLDDARGRLRALTAPGVRERAQREDEAAVVAAAADRKPTPAPAAVDKLEADLAEIRRLVAALESFVADKRADAFAAVAADADRRLQAIDARSDELVERAGALARELAELVAELHDVAADRALVLTLADGNELADDEGVRRLVRAVTRATAWTPPRDTSSPASLLSAVLDHGRRVGAVEVHAKPSDGINRALGVLGQLR